MKNKEYVKKDLSSRCERNYFIGGYSIKDLKNLNGKDFIISDPKGEK